MNNREKIIKNAIAAFLVLAASGHVMAESKDAAPDTSEKCYGIVKAGMNDCATAKASCAGSATRDAQADAFVFMPKGLCEKLVGGRLKSKE